MRAIRPKRCATALSVLLVGCSLSHPAMEDSGATPDGEHGGKSDGTALDCGTWSANTFSVQLDDAAVEVEGAVASRVHPEVLWLHALTKDGGVLIAATRSGSVLRRYALPEPDRGVWRDLATDGHSVVLVGRTSQDDRVDLLVIAEPDPRTDSEITAQVQRVRTSVSPIDAIFFVTREASLFGVSRSADASVLLQLPWPIDDDPPRFTIAGEELAGLEGEVVAADISADERRVAIKMRSDGVRLFEHNEDRTLVSTFDRAFCAGPGAPGRDRSIIVEPDGGYLLLPANEDGVVMQHVLRQEICPSFGRVRQTGTVRAESALELSGIAPSLRQPGVFWSHNDRGEGDFRRWLVAFSLTGEHLGDFDLVDAVNFDWEDIALVRADDDGPDHLYVADIGDNDLERDEVQIVHLREPNVARVDPAELQEVSGQQTYRFRYPDGLSHDAESFLVDPATHDFIVLTKHQEDDPHTRLYAAWAPHDEGEVREFELMADDVVLPFLSPRFTAADLALDRKGVLAQDRRGPVLYWPRGATSSWIRTFMRPACEYESFPDLQLEAIAFHGDGFVMVAEGENPPVLHAPGG